jgi:molybdate transport system substrate-binding protein
MFADRRSGVLPVILLCVACGCGSKTTGPAGQAQSQPGQSGAKEARTQSVELFAAASTQDALKTIVTNFERRNLTVQVNTNLSASGTLAQQISAGAEADVFLSADDKWTVELTEQDQVIEQVDLLGNRLVVIVRNDTELAVTKLEDLLKPEVKRVAMGDPEFVPAGDHAKRALMEANVWNGVTNKLATSKDVRQALTFVETGAAEVGIVYATDVTASDRVKAAFPIDTKMSGRIAYPLALLKAAADKPAARELYDYLQSDEALTVFRQHGFVIHAGSEAGQPAPSEGTATAEQDVAPAGEKQR